MIQVQRFNKALKSAVIIGDLVILDVLFVLQYILWTTCLEQKVSDGTLPQILVLFSLCYFACTISRGIILHRRGVRADQVVQHNLLNMFYFILLSMTTFTLADFGQYSHPFFILFYLLFALFATGWLSVPALKYTENAEATHARQSIWEVQKI